MALSAEEQANRLKLLVEQVNAANDLDEIYQRQSYILEQQNKSISGFLNAQREVVRLSRQESLIKRTQEQISEEIRKTQIGLNQLTLDEQRIAKQNIALLQSKLATLQGTLKEIEDERAVIQDNSNALAAMGNELKDQLVSWTKQEFAVSQIWTYLQQIDGAIRTTQLNLGVSGNKAQMMRQQFEGAVNAAQRFGASAKDISELQEGIADATGRAAAFTSDELVSLVQIAKGTGLQNTEVTKLVGSMQNFGLTVETSKDLIEESVNSTAKLGLSSNNVLKKLIANIDKINNYRFDKGVKGIEEMAKASEKFRFTMEGAFAAADKFRTLEGLLEAGATLRVLGGEFAKMDEFKLSFLARNKPQEFATEMAKLTKGMATFNKTTGEFDVTDVDYDRLRAVAEATGREVGDLVQQAKTFNQINFAKSQIFANIKDSDKEMIASLAKFKPGSTIGTIQIGDKNVKLTELTKDQINLLTQEQKTLKERAEASQNFDESFKNTIMQVKSSLLPLLEYVNKGLDKFNGLIDMFRDSTGKLSAWSLTVPALGLLLGTAGGAIILNLIKAIFSLAGSGIGKLFGGLGGALGGGGGGGIGLMGASIKTLTGIGIAAVGVGAGLYLAAKGAASLASAFKGMSAGQISAVALTLGVLNASIVGIVALAPAMGMAAPELLAFGAGIAAIGAGVGAMYAGLGYGIGQATQGISSIIKAVKGDIDFSGMDFENLENLKILKSFTETDINRMNEMFDILNQINSIDTSKLDALQKLFTNATLKVQLEGNPTINNNITVEVDGEKFYKRVEKMIPIVVKKGVMPK